MQSLEATIVDIDLDIHIRGPDEQEIYIEYEVDGITYSRELKTDTAISFTAGSGAHYSVGDKIDIFYDPQNPEIIASPRSVCVGYFCLIFALFGKTAKPTSNQHLSNRYYKKKAETYVKLTFVCNNVRYAIHKKLIISCVFANYSLQFIVFSAKYR
jgi:hypothetical protein